MDPREQQARAAARRRRELEDRTEDRIGRFARELTARKVDLECPEVDDSDDNGLGGFERSCESELDRILAEAAAREAAAARHGR